MLDIRSDAGFPKTGGQRDEDDDLAVTVTGPLFCARLSTDGSQKGGLEWWLRKESDCHASVSLIPRTPIKKKIRCKW